MCIDLVGEKMSYYPLEQVEAAVAARRIEGMEGRPKSGERRIVGQVDA